MPEVLQVLFHLMTKVLAPPWAGRNLLADLARFTQSTEAVPSPGCSQAGRALSVLESFSLWQWQAGSGSFSRACGWVVSSRMDRLERYEKTDVLWASLPRNPQVLTNFIQPQQLSQPQAGSPLVPLQQDTINSTWLSLGRWRRCEFHGIGRGTSF